MDVPDTVTRALADREVAGKTCLEAGAGIGNMTAGLLDAGAGHVYALTNDRRDAEGVRDRLAEESAAEDRITLLEADLREIPLPDDAVDVVTAHALFNVLPPDAATPVARELSRVAAPGATLVVDDYDPIPGASPIRQLFAVENAAAELANGRPALVFYPAEGLWRHFAGHGWKFERETSILEPVPWTKGHLTAHVAEVRGYTNSVPDPLGKPLVTEAERIAAETGNAEVGRMYSVAMTLPE